MNEIESRHFTVEKMPISLNKPTHIMSYEIEKGIKVPTKAHSKYPFDKMKVGDSFLVPAEQQNHARVTAYAYAKRNNIKIVVRKVDGGFRIWRTA